MAASCYPADNRPARRGISRCAQDNRIVAQAARRRSAVKSARIKEQTKTLSRGAEASTYSPDVAQWDRAGGLGLSKLRPGRGVRPQKHGSGASRQADSKLSFVLSPCTNTRVRQKIDRLTDAQRNAGRAAELCQVASNKFVRWRATAYKQDLTIGSRCAKNVQTSTF